jgi:hypothetical protein
MADYKVNIIELEDFYKMVDQIVVDIESGKIKSNPLKREFNDVGEVIVSSTSTETSLDDIEVIQDHQEEDAPEFDLTGLTDRAVIIRATKNQNILAVYENAAIAAKAQGIHQTTVRVRANANYKDKNGLTWSYHNTDADGGN